MPPKLGSGAPVGCSLTTVKVDGPIASGPPPRQKTTLPSGRARMPVARPVSPEAAPSNVPPAANVGIRRAVGREPHDVRVVGDALDAAARGDQDVAVAVEHHRAERRAVGPDDHVAEARAEAGIDLAVGLQADDGDPRSAARRLQRRGDDDPPVTERVERLDAVERRAGQVDRDLSAAPEARVQRAGLARAQHHELALRHAAGEDLVAGDHVHGAARGVRRGRLQRQRPALREALVGVAGGRVGGGGQEQDQRRERAQGPVHRTKAWHQAVNNAIRLE